MKVRELCDRNYATSQVYVGSVGSREIVERFRNKFIKEAQNIARLKHRNIVSVIDIFEENGTYGGYVCGLLLSFRNSEFMGMYKIKPG